MRELLAPAGNMYAFKAAIANGCNAIYLGMQRFGARAYSANFDVESLKEAITYAHLRNVKIYVNAKEKHLITRCFLFICYFINYIFICDRISKAHISNKRKYHYSAQ